MPSQNTSHRNIFFIIFTVSGFAGLIYESIWTHYLKLFLGHAAYAQTLVLAIFMGGMALGAWLCSKGSSRWRNLLRLYALIEAVVGICALLFHPLYVEFLEQAHTRIIPWLAVPATIGLFKWTSAALLILPQSILLGMTFPLMSAGLIRRFPETPGATLALLYFCNSIGAAAGVLCSGFVFLAWVGLPGTIAIAGLINLALAVVVWNLSRDGYAPSAGKRAEHVEIRPTGLQPQESGYRLLLVVALVTGAASFIYEIGWIRMLTMVMSSSTHAFELMLSAFITGLAFGGLWIKKRIDTLAHPTRFLGVVQLLMGGLALATLPVYNNTFEVMQWLMQHLDKSDTGYALFNISSHAIALGVMLPTTFCAGMTLPLITYLLIRQGHGEKSIGAVYAFNTLGSIAGVLLAVHLLMPYAGLKNLVILGASLDIALGFLLVWRAFPNWPAPAMLSGAAALGVILIWTGVDLVPGKMASGVYRTGALIDPDAADIIFSKDGKSATINVIRWEDNALSIVTNGKPDASINMDPAGKRRADENTMILTGALALAVHPAARTAAIIGMGSGLSTETLLSTPTLDRVDTIEIEPAMVEGARLFGSRVARAYNDPRSHIHIEDAKTWFSTQNKKYDIIVSEPSNPWVSGVAGLFSEEFYHHIRRHLNADGILVQWLQLYEIDLPLLTTVMRALANNYDDYVVYASNVGDIIIVVRPTGQVPNPDPEVLKIEGLSAQLQSIEINHPRDLELRRIGDKQLLHPLFLSYEMPANSDYFPVLDLNAAATRFLGSSAQELLALNRAPIPVLEVLRPITASAENRKPSVDVHFPRSQHGNLAYMLYNYISGGQWEWEDPDMPLPPNIRENAEFAKSAIMQCARSIPQSDWLTGMFNNVAKRIIPYLQPTELESIWHMLEDSRCWNSLDPLQRDMVSLYKAVSMRNGAAMATSAAKILKNAQNVSPSILEYLLAAGMTGELATGNQDGARLLWRSYSAKLDQPVPLYLRLLLAHSFGSEVGAVLARPNSSFSHTPAQAWSRESQQKF